MKHRPMNKAQILANLHAQKADRNIIIGGRVGMICSILILSDVFDFNQEEMDTYLDSYQTLLDSYNNGNEDAGAWVDGIKEKYGIDVLGELAGEKR